MTNILVTGGAGFIGSHVTETLVQRGRNVVVLDDLSGGFQDNVPHGARFIQGSITDVDLVKRIFAETPFDHVYHLAAYAAEGLSHFIKRFNYMNNVIGSINLINACLNTNVKSFVFTSSIAVYGSSPELPLREETPEHPEDSYGIAKLAVEQELKACEAMFGLQYTIFRPHNVFGPRQNGGDFYRNVVAIFMNQILQHKPMTIFGDGTQTRAFSYINDVASVIADAIDVPAARNQIFNVGADQVCSINDLAQYVAHAMGVKPNVVYLPARHEVGHAYSSHDRVRRVFGEGTRTALEKGLGAMAAWAKERGPRTTRRFEDIEVTRNFPAAWLTK